MALRALVTNSDCKRASSSSVEGEYASVHAAAAVRFGGPLRPMSAAPLASLLAVAAPSPLPRAPLSPHPATYSTS